MDGKKAAGIDGITKEDYEKNLEENLARLVESLKRKAYKPKPARKVEIPKENGKTRPISIYCYEDKLVQEGLSFTGTQNKLYNKRDNIRFHIFFLFFVRFNNFYIIKFI